MSLCLQLETECSFLNSYEKISKSWNNILFISYLAEILNLVTGKIPIKAAKWTLPLQVYFKSKTEENLNLALEYVNFSLCWKRQFRNVCVKIRDLGPKCDLRLWNRKIDGLDNRLLNKMSYNKSLSVVPIIPKYISF